MGNGVHIVVPDINFYLTIAKQLGEGFTITSLKGRLHENWGPFRPLFFMLQKHPDGNAIEIWANDHIVTTAMRKASQPIPDGHRPPEKCGMGWHDNNTAAISDMIVALVERTNGQVMLNSGIFWHPPLDAEDGTVMGCARCARQSEYVEDRYCLTYDRKMINDMKENQLVHVVHPMEWAAMIDLEQRRKRRRMSVHGQYPGII